MMGWTEFISAFGVFFLTHTIPVWPRNRARLVAVLGESGFSVCYSVLSLGVLIWLIGSAGRAPFVSLWPWAPWQNHVALAAMAMVCLILALSIGRPNPFSFGGSRNSDFDPANPGLVRYTRHPLLLAIALWSFAHVVPNGNLAHVLLFGTFCVFALLGRKIVDRRKQRQMGASWDVIAVQVKGAALVPDLRYVGAMMIRIGAGLVLYFGLLWLHPWAIGVSPLP